MILLIVVIVALLAIIVGLWASMANRRKKLQEQFGPEYDRLVTQSQSRRMAEAEMTERARRVKKLDLRELSEPAREQYIAQWAGLQERFVDDPGAAIADGQRLVEAVMRDSGYSAVEFNQTIADLSVEHAQQLDHLRQAHEIGEKAAAGQASTEEVRIAMLHYRDLFSELLAIPNSLAGGTTGTTESPETARERERQIAADEAPNGAPAVRPADTAVTGPDPIQVPHDDVMILPDDDDPAIDEESDAEELEAGTARRGRR